MRRITRHQIAALALLVVLALAMIGMSAASINATLTSTTNATPITGSSADTLLHSAISLAPATSLLPSTSSCVDPLSGRCCVALGSSGNWYCAPNWSGYAVYSDTFDQVKGNWNVQCPGSGNQNGYFESTWVGIGGINGALVQVGTSYAGDPDGGIPFHYYPFFAFVPSSGSGGTLFMDTAAPLSCTTPVSGQVYHNSSNQWCASLTWGSLNYTDCFSSADQPNQGTAEWIDERPTCNNNRVADLWNFNYTNFSNAYAHSIYRSWHTIGGFPRYQIGMYDIQGGYWSSNDAYPHNLNTGDTSFTDTFVRVGNGVLCTAPPYYDYQ